MKITGKILEIKDIQQVSETFKKRMFIIEYAENPQYPEFISFELIQDRCDLLNSFKPGQEVEVSFNLKGRKWLNSEGETKYFNSLQAWRITSAVSPTVTHNPEVSDTKQDSDLDDDLPF